MEEANFRIHNLLQRDFGASNRTARNANRMPAPLCDLILSADHPQNVATITLLEGSLRYYPLEVEDFLKSDVLRVHFQCRAKDRVVTTRFTRPELDTQERRLVPFHNEAVAAWNIVQLRMAKIVMDNAPQSGRAVSRAAVDAMRASPRSFYEMLTSHPAPGVH